MKCMNVSVLQS